MATTLTRFSDRRNENRSEMMSGVPLASPQVPALIPEVEMQAWQAWIEVFYKCNTKSFIFSVEITRLRYNPHLLTF